MTSPRSIPMPPRPSRLSVSSQVHGHSPNTPSSVKSPLSPLSQMPVRTYRDGLEERRGSNLSPNSAYDQDGYFASRNPGSQCTSPKPRPKAEYKDPFEETFIPPIGGPIKERERAPRLPASPSSLANSITDIRPGHSRKPSGTHGPLLSPRQGSSAGTPRPGSSTSTRADEVDEQLELLRQEHEAKRQSNEATRKAREKSLNDWKTRMTDKMSTERGFLQERMRTDFENSAKLQDCLEVFGWRLETAVERNKEPIANLSLDFTDSYNKHVAAIYEKYRTQDIKGLPSEDVDFVTSTKVRKGKSDSDWSGLPEAPGCRVTTEFTLTIAGGKHTEPVTRQRRQKYDDLLTTVTPPQIFVPDIGLKKSRRSESRDDYDDERDRRPEITYDSRYDGRGRRGEIAYDSRYPDERGKKSLVLSGGRERSGDEEVPRQETLLLVPGEPQRRGNSTTTKYRYDTSQPPSDVGTRNPSKEPSRRGSRLPSGATSREPSQPPPRAPASRKHRSRTERTESEEREREMRHRRKRDRSSRH